MILSRFFSRHPEWWVWGLSLLVWGWLAAGQLAASSGRLSASASDGVIYCMPGMVGYSAAGAAVVSHGLMNWVLMVIAMMFPLLNEPVRHVAFSVRRSDRGRAVLCFLIGYTLLWTVAGVIFGLLPLNRVIGACLFVLAAISIWLPGRGVRMTKCSLTMPIRIHGSGLYADSLRYGLRMGIICIQLCWVPMIALVLSHHNVLLMYLVTVVLLFERYLVPHTSKFSGYAWGAIALALFGVF